MAIAVVIQKFIIECCVGAYAMEDLSLAEQRERSTEIYSFFISIEMSIILILLTAQFRTRNPELETTADLNDSMVFETLGTGREDKEA